MKMSIIAKHPALGLALLYAAVPSVHAHVRGKGGENLYFHWKGKA